MLQGKYNQLSRDEREDIRYYYKHGYSFMVSYVGKYPSLLLRTVQELAKRSSRADERINQKSASDKCCAWKVESADTSIGKPHNLLNNFAKMLAIMIKIHHNVVMNSKQARKYKMTIRAIIVICGMFLVLLIVFNARTQVPFSIGFRVFQIPFFAAFAIAYAMGLVSCFVLMRRLNKNSDSKAKDDDSVK